MSANQPDPTTHANEARDLLDTLTTSSGERIIAHALLAIAGELHALNETLDGIDTILRNGVQVETTR